MSAVGQEISSQGNKNLMFINNFIQCFSVSFFTIHRERKVNNEIIVILIS